MFDFLFRRPRLSPPPAPASWPWSNPTDAVAEKYRDQRDAAHKALREIAAMKTENCAHIGKRMAAVAAAALPKIPA